MHPLGRWCFGWWNAFREVAIPACPVLVLYPVKDVKVRCPNCVNALLIDIRLFRGGPTATWHYYRRSHKLNHLGLGKVFLLGPVGVPLLFGVYYHLATVWISRLIVYRLSPTLVYPHPYSTNTAVYLQYTCRFRFVTGFYQIRPVRTSPLHNRTMKPC